MLRTGSIPERVDNHVLLSTADPQLAGRPPRDSVAETTVPELSRTVTIAGQGPQVGAVPAKDPDLLEADIQHVDAPGGVHRNVVDASETLRSVAQDVPQSEFPRPGATPR